VHVTVVLINTVVTCEGCHVEFGVADASWADGFLHSERMGPRNDRAAVRPSISRIRRSFHGFRCSASLSRV